MKGAAPAALLALLLSSCATTPPTPTTAQEALRPYYASLRRDLPRAPAGPRLDLSKALTRIAFGSCIQQNRPQAIWNSVAATDPDLFLFIGDNVYGDTAATGAADIPTLTAAYKRLGEREEFAAFRARIPMLATWDDHDFGQNDAGATFAHKEWAERVFETYWGSGVDVRARPGIYDSVIAGPAGRRVQILMLDTRFFRSDLKSRPYQDPPPPLGWFVPSEDPAAALLGDAQWRWLDAELAKPVDLRLVVTSIQLVTDAHGYEKWGNIPRERERMYKLLADRRIGNAVVLSGDRHQGGIYRHRPAGLAQPLNEITSSSMNLSFARPGQPERLEPDPRRLDGMFSQENFGMVEIDWERREVSLGLRGAGGEKLASRTVALPR